MLFAHLLRLGLNTPKVMHSYRFKIPRLMQEGDNPRLDLWLKQETIKKFNIQINPLLDFLYINKLICRVRARTITWP